MPTLCRSRRVFSTLLFALSLAPLAASSTQAGWQKDAVCQGSCGGGCGPCPDPSSRSSSSSSDMKLPPAGGWTKRYWEKVKESRNPFQAVLQSVLGLPIGLLLDTPYFLFKGGAYGLHYAGKGTVAAGKGIGKAVAYPFNRPAKLRPSASTWRQYKRDVLAYQKAVTKRNPSNRANQRWCKDHLPASMEVDRTAWESACNPNGSVEHTGAVTVPKPPGELAASRRAKALGCAVADAGRLAASAGPEGAKVAAELDADLARILADLKARPPSGDEKDEVVFTSGNDYSVKDAAGERQFLARLTVVRTERTGEVRIGVESSFTEAGRTEQGGQDIIHLDSSGAVTAKEVSRATGSCLER